MVLYILNAIAPALIITTPHPLSLVELIHRGNNCVLIIINFIQGWNCIKMKETFFLSVRLARNQKHTHTEREHFICVGSSSQKLSAISFAWFVWCFGNWARFFSLLVVCTNNNTNTNTNVYRLVINLVNTFLAIFILKTYQSLSYYDKIASQLHRAI